MNKTLLLVIFAAGALLSCAEGPAPSPDSSAGPVGFVNRVWTVQSSTSVASGTLYVFLEEGTLIITSRNSRPAVGTWTYKDRSLIMVEESIPYRVEILHLSKDEFRIRSHNPGEPVELTLVPAVTASAQPYGTRIE